MVLDIYLLMKRCQFQGTSFTKILLQRKQKKADLGTLKPLMRIDEPPDRNAQHGSNIYEAGPVHRRGAASSSFVNMYRLNT